MDEQTKFNEMVRNVGLSDIHTRKPLIDGKIICQMFEVKPGKIMKPLTEEVMKFQILNPLADEALAKNFLEANKELFLQKYN
jgi:hypothetical protein